MPPPVPPLGSPAELRQRRLRKIRLLLALGLFVFLVVALFGTWHAGKRMGAANQARIDRLARELDNMP